MSLSFRHVRKSAKSEYQLRHVRLSVRVEQLGPHWTEFDEIWHLSIFRKKMVRKFKYN